MVHPATGLDAKLLKTRDLIKSLLVEIPGQPRVVACSTKFAPDSAVFLHLITSIKADMPFIWVDTGYNRRDTMTYVAEATDKLKLNLHVYKPEGHELRIPPELDDPDHKAFAEEVKLAPFRGALKDMGVTHWISSVRAYQTPNRKTLPTTQVLSDQLTKIHPMLEWTQADVDEYRTRFGLPTGPEAYDPTKGDSMGECGLHKVSSFF